MPKETLQIKHFTPAELKSLFTEDDNFQQAIRLFACYQISTGVSPEEVAIFYEMSLKTICNWVNRLNEGGIEALIDEEKPGNKCC